MPNIAVFDYRITDDIKKIISDIADNHVEFPDKLYSKSELTSKSGDADIILVSPWDKISKNFLDKCPSVKYIGLCGTSTSNIDLDEIKNRGIKFSRVVSRDKKAVAEYYFMQLVSLSRGAHKYQWKPQQRELAGKKIGIIGLGHVGQAMAHMALAYKMVVSYYSPHRKAYWEKRNVRYLDLNKLLANNEVIVICSPTNVIVIKEDGFKAMSSGGVLVQASAGTPFDQNAFFSWVKKDGNFAIFELSAGESNYLKYKDLPGVIFPRTVAGDTYEANERRSKKVLRNLKEYLALN